MNLATFSLLLCQLVIVVVAVPIGVLVLMSAWEDWTALLPLVPPLALWAYLRLDKAMDTVWAGQRALARQKALEEHEAGARP